MFIDTHTHLYSEEFNEDRTAIINKAISNSVTKLSAMCNLCKNGTLASFSRRMTNEQNTILVGNKTEYLL